MNNSTVTFLKVLRLLAWIAFLGLLVKAGAIVMSFGISINTPEAASDLYKGMDLSRYENFSFFQYTCIVMYFILMYLFQAYVALFVAKLLQSSHIEKPYSETVLRLLQKISYTILAVFMIAVLHNIHVGILQQMAGIIPEYISAELIFLTGTVYVLARLFQRNVAMRISS